MKPTAVSFEALDGDRYTFDLKLGQIRELQEKCGAGVFVIAGRLFARQCYVDDVRETIRLGLIGGGMSPSKAWVLVSRYVEGRPLAESLPVAMAIMGGLLHGAPDVEEGADDDANPPMAPRPESSTSAPSMEAAARSASRRAKSTVSSSGNGGPSSTAGTEFTAPTRGRRRQAPANIKNELQG